MFVRAKVHIYLDSFFYKVKKKRLSNLIVKLNKNGFFVILNHHWDPAIGDACYGLSCAKEYKNRTNKKLCYIYPERHKIIKRLINMYDFINKKIEISYYTEELFLNKWPEVFSYLDKKGCKYFLSYAYSYYEIGRYTDDLSLFDAIKDIYGIEKTFNNYAHPSVNKSLIDNSIKLIDYKVLIHFDSHSLKSTKIFNKLQMIIDDYRNKSYLVFINLLPNQANPFANCIGYNCSLESLYANAHLFDEIIGIRGGIMDLLSSQAKSMTVLYDNSAFSRKLYNMQKVSDWVKDKTVIKDIII